MCEPIETQGNNQAVSGRQHTKKKDVGMASSAIWVAQQGYCSELTRNCLVDLIKIDTSSG